MHILDKWRQIHAWERDMLQQITLSTHINCLAFFSVDDPGYLKKDLYMHTPTLTANTSVSLSTTLPVYHHCKAEHDSPHPPQNMLLFRAAILCSLWTENLGSEPAKRIWGTRRDPCMLTKSDRSWPNIGPTCALAQPQWPWTSVSSV